MSDAAKFLGDSARTVLRGGESRKLTDPTDELRVKMPCVLDDHPISVSGPSWNEINRKLDRAGYKRADAPNADYRVCLNEHASGDYRQAQLTIRVSMDCPRCGRAINVIGDSWNDVNAKLDANGYQRAPFPKGDLRICLNRHGDGADIDGMVEL